MNAYSIVLFIHIVAAMGFFIALGVEWISLRQMRAATTYEQIRESMRTSRGIQRLGMASMLTILAAGFYLMAMEWGGVAWIIVALGAVVVVIAVSAVLTRPQMATIGQALSTGNGPVPSATRSALHHPALWISIQTRVAIALGIVFLMSVKPDLVGSLLTITVATIAGLVAALPMSRRERVQEGPAD